MRLFIAVDVPLSQKIKDLLKEIDKSGADVKTVEPENLHLTLLFIGEKREDDLKTIEEIMNSLKEKNSFSASARGVGFFPNLDRPRVIWIGIEDHGNLSEIRKQLVNSFKERKITFDDRNEFSPHLTLGRIRSPRGIENIKRIWEERKHEDFGNFKVDKVMLFKSILTPRGPIYEELHSVGLKETSLS
jgi:2'-5' RNA ligase